MRGGRVLRDSNGGGEGNRGAGAMREDVMHSPFCVARRNCHVERCTAAVDTRHRRKRLHGAGKRFVFSTTRTLLINEVPKKVR